MAESFKEKVADTGHKIAEAASHAGHAIGEKAEEAKDWVKEKAHEVGHKLEEAKEWAGSISDIHEHQDVIASCGTKVGKVDHVQGTHIKLTKNDSPDGQHHLIPLTWVANVDRSGVHLTKNHLEVQGQWQTA